MRLLYLLGVCTLLCLNSSSLLAQRYSNIIEQQLSEADLVYMPVAELKVLKNEIIALKGAKSSKSGLKSNASPFAQYSCTQYFLNETDQANIKLINRMIAEGPKVTCSEEELFTTFLGMASSKQQIPFYLAQKYYGLCLDKDMSRHQKVLQLSDQLMAFWVPQFSTCEDCPYQNHFVTINTKGERIANLRVEGLLTVLENNILEISKVTSSVSGTATKPEYYQILADGQLDFTGNQMVQANTN